ncbi:PAS domain S-box protein [Paenibacillus albicereus]|uniref:histidine kinase n=1 Tax=Paenibacillus albicereus TaxID=2726185 RepID=A0A6H2H2S7_9BACL|nr:ATP-binding protein [Paenibacillus albicereus]QJC53899.1 PAS domain S-box protein [Paenibacillus albicereus]
MSIKLKLSALIFAVVTIMLSLNLLVFYLYTGNQSRHAAERQLHAVGDQIRGSITPVLKDSYHLELGQSERLRVASIAVRALVGGKAGAVDSGRLEELRGKLGLDSIALIRPVDGEMAIEKSTRPNEAGTVLSAVAPPYDALRQLYRSRYVTLPGGTSLQDFWASGATVRDEGRSVMTSYYYDGSMDYLVRLTLESSSSVRSGQQEGELQVGASVLRIPGLMELSGFNYSLMPAPGAEGVPDEASILPHSGALEFGSYRLAEADDYGRIRQAVRAGKTLTVDTTIDGVPALRGYIPYSVDNIRDYALVVTIDKTVFSRDLRQQLILLLAISVMLVVMTVIVSYGLAGVAVRSLKLVVRRVNQLAAGNFSQPVTVRSNDEIGELAFSVNVMATNLDSYTNRLKESAEELRRTKEYLESLVVHTRDAIHSYDLKGGLISANRAFETMFGWSEAELKAPGGMDVLPQEQRWNLERMIESVLLGVPWIDAETWMQSREGLRIDVSTTASPIRDQHGEIIAVSCITRNMTSRKQTEELLRRTEKLTIVGQLAAGVAHEIRNPLTTLRGFVQMQLKGKALAPYYQTIMLGELDRINFIVSEFLVLAKPQADRFQDCRLKAILEDMAALIEPEALLNDVRVRMELGGGDPIVAGEPNQLKQVFLNLMKNGIEAMSERGGRLSVTLVSVPGQVVVQLRDEGVGISEEQLARLGEPFFTSKEKGNGLGLMVSQRIVNNHGGSLVVRSKVGEGTEVSVSLPAKEREAGLSQPNSG